MSLLNCNRDTMNEVNDIPSVATTTEVTSSDYPVALDLTEKSEVVFRLITNESGPSAESLRDMCTRHQSISSRCPEVNRISMVTLRKSFLDHECTLNCLVLKSEAELAGLPTEVPLDPDVVKICVRELARFNRKRNSASKSSLAYRFALLRRRCSWDIVDKNEKVRTRTWQLVLDSLRIIPTPSNDDFVMIPAPSPKAIKREASPSAVSGPSSSKKPKRGSRKRAIIEDVDMDEDNEEEL
jgi:hypothetical protein